MRVRSCHSGAFGVLFGTLVPSFQQFSEDSGFNRSPFCAVKSGYLCIDTISDPNFYS